MFGLFWGVVRLFEIGLVWVVRLLGLFLGRSVVRVRGRLGRSVVRPVVRAVQWSFGSFGC